MMSLFRLHRRFEGVLESLDLVALDQLNFESSEFPCVTHLSLVWRYKHL